MDQLTTRFPDKPTRSSPTVLKMMGKGDNIALSKLDGFRCRTVVGGDGNVSFLSSSGGTLPVSSRIRDAVRRLIEAGKIPLSSVLDGEWMKLRPQYDGPECIYYFSPMVLANEWVGHMSFRTRWEWINGLGLPVDNLAVTRSDQMPNNPLILPKSTTEDLDAFFEKHKEIWRTEGIVTYKANGMICGDRRGQKKSRDMYKFKWRDGHSGRTHVV